MISYSLRDGALFVGEASAPVALPLPVEEVVAFDDILVVRIRATSAVTRNVFGIDGSGQIAWQIEELPMNRLHDTFLGITRKSDSTVVGYYSLGFLFHIDAKTGRIVSGDFTH